MNGTVLELPEILDSKAARPLQAELLARRGRPLILDAAKVQRLGGLCLQVLLAAQIAWRDDDLDLCLAHPSADFDAGWTLFSAPAFHSAVH